LQFASLVLSFEYNSTLESWLDKHKCYRVAASTAYLI